MMRKRLVGLLVALSLVAGLPIMTSAQDDSETPEGTDWSLTSYLSDDSADEMTVPFGVVATLRMEDGEATGSGGCNAFNGSYRLREDSLIFSDQLTRTLKLCEDEVQDVEDIYLSNLPKVSTWTITNGVLELYDEFDDVILTFEVPNVVLTAGQLASLMDTITQMQADIAAVDQRVDNVNIRVLRDRIKELEQDTARLKKQVGSAPRATPRPTGRPTPRPPDQADFDKGERVLLRGIPARIASRCEPWRQIVPPGTVAAVRCTPNTNTTASVIYHLLEGADAQSAFSNEMAFRNVPESPGQACANGNRGWRILDPDVGWVAEGCDRDPGPTVFMAFTDWATDCKRLNVGGTRLRNPAYYITLTGNHNDIARTYEWATRASLSLPGKITSIADDIPSKLKVAPACVGTA